MTKFRDHHFYLIENGADNCFGNIGTNFSEQLPMQLL